MNWILIIAIVAAVLIVYWLLRLLFVKKEAVSPRWELQAWPRIRLGRGERCPEHPLAVLESFITGSNRGWCGTGRWASVEYICPDCKPEAVSLPVLGLMFDEETDDICEICHQTMVKKSGKFGQVLLCSGFSECNNVGSFMGKSGFSVDKVKPIDSWQGYVEFNKDGVFLIHGDDHPERHELPERKRRKSPVHIKNASFNYWDNNDLATYQSSTCPSRWSYGESEMVEVYKNLHGDFWSVRSVRTGGVTYHRNPLILSNVDFSVQSVEHIRTLKDRSDNVYAFVRGRLEFPQFIACREDRQGQVCYDPYLSPYFYADQSGDVL